MQLNGASDQKGYAPHQKGHDADLYFPQCPALESHPLDAKLQNSGDNN